MGLILCATRGGEASLHAQNAAIALAKERGDELAFLYIINLKFLDKTAAPIMVDVENELAQLGNFLLLVAKERASEKGVITRTLSQKSRTRNRCVSGCSRSSRRKKEYLSIIQTPSLCR